jgi:hypothetical protein
MLQHKTMAMSVANTAFMIDRLSKDCAPLQFLRELTQNSIEAILASGGTGEIVWDCDWDQHDLTGNYKLCTIDNGVGMTGTEMIGFINQLSSSVHQQSHGGNFGVGAKVSAVPRNQAGLVYLSWKNGVGSMIHVWRDPKEDMYGLKQFEQPDGDSTYTPTIEDAIRPEVIRDHGTKVVLHGDSADDNTMQAPEGAMSPSRWISRYLNTRYYRFPKGITVKAREGWEYPRADRDRNLLRTIVGQKLYLDTHAEHSGAVPLSYATAHWWILKDEPALGNNSGWIASNGHVAALYQDELYEMAISRGGVAKLQSFGVVFGYPRVVIYVEPSAGDNAVVVSNTARTSLILNDEPLPWSDWAAEFRALMPKPIQELMEEVAAGSSSKDHTQTVWERLKQIRELLKLSKYRPSPSGDLLIDSDSTIPYGGGKTGTKRDGSQGTNGLSGGATGAPKQTQDFYSLFIANKGGVPGKELRGSLPPEIRWVSAADKTRQPGFLEDRAAKYLPEQNLLQINEDFRVFTDMNDRWSKFYANVPGARETIKDVVREWFEQQLVETILGLQSLKGSKEWNDEQVKSSWSEESLTTAVMPRYHVDIAVKRTLGSKLGAIKDRAA